MEIRIELSARDIDLVKRLNKDFSKNDFVKHRINRNVRKVRLPLTAKRCWHAHMMCQLTTQQRSGPSSNVYRFLSNTPFALELSVVKNQQHPRSYIAKSLRSSGGIRRIDTIADHASKNLDWFRGPGWHELRAKLVSLASAGGYANERKLANWLTDTARFHGLGPKQSRNFLQALGLTQYEIPIDSRITKRLRDDFEFPLAISSAALSDPEHYAVVNDVIHELCARAKMKPCVFDAILFAQVDGDEWNGVKPLF